MAFVRKTASVENEQNQAAIERLRHHEQYLRKEAEKNENNQRLEAIFRAAVSPSASDVQETERVLLAALLSLQRRDFREDPRLTVEDCTLLIDWWGDGNSPGTARATQLTRDPLKAVARETARRWRAAGGTVVVDYTEERRDLLQAMSARERMEYLGLLAAQQGRVEAAMAFLTDADPPRAPPAPPAPRPSLEVPTPLVAVPPGPQPERWREKAWVWITYTVTAGGGLWGASLVLTRPGLGAGGWSERIFHSVGAFFLFGFFCFWTWGACIALLVYLLRAVRRGLGGVVDKLRSRPPGVSP